MLYYSVVDNTKMQIRRRLSQGLGIYRVKRQITREPGLSVNPGVEYEQCEMSKKIKQGSDPFINTHLFWFY